MKITDIFVKSFGKLKGVKISPTNGVNIIYGENECGKSTIMNFILAMLFGLGKGDARRRYEPWSGGRMAGVIGFEYGENSYVLSRKFGATGSADVIQLINRLTGAEVSLPDKCEPGEYLMGINRSTFTNSVYIGQAGTSIQGDSGEILAKLMNLASSGDETTSHTVILDRLSEAMAGLRSKRASALLPALEKERSALLESRADAVRIVEDTDALREQAAELSAGKARLEAEISSIETALETAASAAKLAEYEDIIIQRESLATTENKYNKLHRFLFGGETSLSVEFLDNARDKLEGYHSQQAVIEAKRGQLAECLERLEAIDRSPLENISVIKRYSAEIGTAFENYRRYSDEKIRIEKKLEQAEPPKKPGLFTQKNILIAGAALVVGLVLMGIAWNMLFVVAGVCAAGLLGYYFIQRGGSTIAGVSGGSIELENIQQDLRGLNKEMRPILSLLGVNSMSELDILQRTISQTMSQIERGELESNRLAAEIGALEEEQAEIFGFLKEKLSDYKTIDSDTEAVKIITALDRALRDHNELEVKFKSELDAFENRLAGRDYDTIYLLADELRASIPEGITQLGGEECTGLEHRAENLRDERNELDRQVIKLNAELKLSAANPQNLNEIADKLKVVNEKIEKLEFEYSAIETAADCITEAFQSMQRDFGPMINFRASKIVEQLTGGAYRTVVVSEKLVPSVTDTGNGDIRPALNLSSGTIDQIYLALRIAIAGVLTEESLPLLLDDALAQYDHRRAAGALRYMRDQNAAGELGQVLLFTCHDGLMNASRELGLEPCLIGQIDEK